MRVHNLIHKIKNSYAYKRILELENTRTETDFAAKKYNAEYNLYPSDERGYFKSRYMYLYDMFERELCYHNKVRFQYGIWGEVTANFTVKWSRYERNIQARVSFYFHDLRGTPKAIWESNSFEMPLNTNFCNPKKCAIKILRSKLIEEGYFAEKQLRMNCYIKELKSYYIKLMNYQYPVKISDKDFYKAVKRRFNVDSFLSIEDTARIINRIGRQDKMVKLEKYDSSWIFDFDGDIDELEREFYDTQEENVIYV
jgi:hypothetical protein